MKRFLQFTHQVLLIDPRDPNTLYAGTYDGGVFEMTFAPELETFGGVRKR